MNLRDRVDKLGFAETPEQIFWSYDDMPFSLRTKSDQVYIEKPVSGLPVKPQTIKDEAFLAARKISDKFSKPTILYSGGIDSEAVILSFFLQKLPFNVVVVDYNGLNAHDITTAKKFCDSLGIAYTVLQRDVLSFWENDLESLALKINCTSPQIAAHCWIAGQIDEYLIFGDGDSSLMRAHKYFFETKSEKWALARWMLHHEKSGCPRFFQYTAGLEASVYFEPLVEQFVDGAWQFFEFRKFMYLKPFIYHKYFGCNLRTKFSGFENMAICEDYRKKLSSMMSEPHYLSWSYANARRWALEKEPVLKLSHLQQSLIPELEKEGLNPYRFGTYRLWEGPTF